MKKLSTKQFIQKAIAKHGHKYDYSLTYYINSSIKVTIICPIHGEFIQTPNSHLNGQGCSSCSNNKKLTKETFIEKARKVHGNKYDYSKINCNGNKNKGIIICTEHGEFLQTLDIHLQGKGCPKCKNKLLKLMYISNTQEFIQKAKVIHDNKYDYSKVEYVNAISKVIIICKKHGEFLQTPAIHLSRHGCPICKASKGELAIKAILDKHSIESKQEWKLPDEKYKYEYDFWLPNHNLLIEFHGRQHYEWIPYFHKTHFEFKEQQRRDLEKIDLAKMKSISLIEISHKQLKHMTFEQFEEMIINKINKFKKIK